MITRIQSTRLRYGFPHQTTQSVLCEERGGNSEVSRIVHTVFAWNQAYLYQVLSLVS